ncbi:MAG: GDP-L-fucose synthase [Bacteroidales bacterium]|nr:GDP-L-fucose synthase [Bacteroidales bacterium]
MIDKNAKIYVAGHRGLVGSAIWRNLQQRGYTNLVGRTHAELDLLDAAAVRVFFDTERPDAVVLAAAHVGGIMANSVYRADFIYQNLQIQQNVIGEAWRHGVRKLLFLGSTCIYPREAPQPITEDALLTSPLEYTNEPYAIAKIAGLKLCESLNLQYGTDYIAVMPTNLYGPNDNFDLVNSHVLPAMIRKMHLARLLSEGNLDALRDDLTRLPVKGLDAATASIDRIAATLAQFGIHATHLDLWGSGRPLREFLWSEDMADASVHILLNVTFDDVRGDRSDVRNTHINIGTGLELTIAELAEMIRRTVGFNGEIRWDASKPDGTMRKLCDVSKLHSLGWHHSVELPDGVRRLYDWYLAR